VLAVPFGSSTVLPIVDMVNDYGLFVREAIESPAFGPGSEILTHGELITLGDCVSQLAESAQNYYHDWLCRFLLTRPPALIVTGKKISCVELSDDEFISAFPASRHVAMEMLDSFHYIQEFGCKFASYHT
jgi:hypothetical protein